VTGTEVRQIELPPDARALSRLSDIGEEGGGLCRRAAVISRNGEERARGEELARLT